MSTSQILYRFCYHCPHTNTNTNPKVRKDLSFQSKSREFFTYTHQTFSMAAPRDLTENTKSSRKSSKENNFTPFFETLWNISDMSVDLLRLSLRYWMPAMNPFTPNSRLSSIIIALFQQSGSDKGGWGEFLLTSWWTSMGLVHWGHEIWSRTNSFICPGLIKSGLMMTKHCIAMYNLMREYLTTVKSYHHCSNFLLQLNTCKVSIGISPTAHRRKHY